MYSIPSDRAVDGDYVVPDPLNNEIAELVRSANNLDNDNIPPGTLTPQKVHPLGWGRVLDAAISTMRTSVFSRSLTAGDVYPIPNGAGDPWFHDVATGDGLLALKLGAEYTRETYAIPETALWVGLRVDGVLVAQSPGGDPAHFGDTGVVFGTFPVGAGVHRIEPVFGMVVSASPPSSLTIQWLHRHLAVREVAR